MRGLLSRPPPRFSLREPPRARFIPGSHDFPVDEGFPGLLPYLCLLEIDQALKVAALFSYQATSSNLRRRLRKGRGRKEKGEGIRERGKGTSFPFALFSPSPPLPSPVLRLPRNLTSSKKQKYLEPYWKKKTKVMRSFLNSILYICEANYQTAQTPEVSSVPQWPCFRFFNRAGGGGGVGVYNKYHHHHHRSNLQYLSSESNYKYDIRSWMK